MASKTDRKGAAAKSAVFTEHLCAEPPGKGSVTCAVLFTPGARFCLFSSSICRRLGCPGFTLPEYKPNPVEEGASKSLFFPDEAINKHPRFR